MKYLMGDNASSITKVLGVGGGGCNVVNKLFKQEIKGVDFIICDTDIRSVELSRVPSKFYLGDSFLENFNSSSIHKNEKIPTLESIWDIKQMLGFNTKLLFIITGLGGETGTAASPIMAKAARDMDILTMALVSTPFLFEGKQRNLLASERLATLKKLVDTFMAISHNKLCQLSGQLNLGSEFEEANQIFSHAVKSICGILTSNGYINVGIKDVRTAMKRKGFSMMCSASAKGVDRAVNAIKGALANIPSNENKIRDAGNILLTISSCDGDVTIDEISVIIDHIQYEACPAAELVWCNCPDITLGEALSVTILATGFQTSDELEKY